MAQSSTIPEDVFLEAAQWWRRAQGGASDDMRLLESWLAEDTRHAEAFAYIRSTWESFDEHPASPEMLRIRNRVLARAERTWRQRLNPYIADRRMVMGVMGAACVTAVTLFLTRRRPATIKTTIGEQRTSMLADGSRVTVDANSSVSWDFDKRSRAIQLESGRVHFDVAKDPNRPFSVRALDTTVTAIGTAFSVEIRNKVVKVTLFEGRIQVTKASMSEASAQSLGEVKPAQQIVLDDDSPAPPQIRTVDEQQELGWRDSQLFFDDQPLSEVADRMNDYSHEKVTVEGAAKDVRISGMYIAGKTDAFIDALQRFYPVKAQTTSDGITILPKS